MGRILRGERRFIFTSSSQSKMILKINSALEAENKRLTKRKELKRRGNRREKRKKKRRKRNLHVRS